MTVGVVDTAEVVVAAAVEGTAAVAVAEAGAETSDPGIGEGPLSRAEGRSVPKTRCDLTWR